MEIKMYEAEIGAEVADALREMYFKVVDGGCAVMKFNDVTITMSGKTVEDTAGVISEVSKIG